MRIVGRRRLRPLHALALSAGGAGMVYSGIWTAASLNSIAGVLLGSGIVMGGGALWLLAAARFSRPLDELDVRAVRHAG